MIGFGFQKFLILSDWKACFCDARANHSKIYERHSAQERKAHEVESGEDHQLTHFLKVLAAVM